jgi:hypothetical protein
MSAPSGPKKPEEAEDRAKLGRPIVAGSCDTDNGRDDRGGRTDEKGKATCIAVGKAGIFSGRQG